MSDYKRFISYIYLYDKGSKVKNTGFAKIDSRDGQCSIYIQIKGVYISQADHAQLYLFYRNHKELPGLCIGEFVLKNGLGEHRAVLDPAFFEQAGRGLSEMAGLYIRIGKNRVCATVWDDEPIYVERLRDIPLKQKTDLQAAEDGKTLAEPAIDLQQERNALEPERKEAPVASEQRKIQPVEGQQSSGHDIVKEKGQTCFNQDAFAQTDREKGMPEKPVLKEGSVKRQTDQDRAEQKAAPGRSVLEEKAPEAKHEPDSLKILPNDPSDREAEIQSQAGAETLEIGEEEAKPERLSEKSGLEPEACAAAVPLEKENERNSELEILAMRAASCQEAPAQTMQPQAYFRPAGENRGGFQGKNRMRMEGFGGGRVRGGFQGRNNGFSQEQERAVRAEKTGNSGFSENDRNDSRQRMSDSPMEKQTAAAAGRGRSEYDLEKQPQKKAESEHTASVSEDRGERVNQQAKKTVENMSSDEKWSLLKKNYAVVHPFENNEEMEWIRIEPKDIDQLSKEEWILGNNSFLLHGYCNYKYLILGRNPETKVCCIGVPGVFYQKERMMANMFGFTDFRMAQGTSLRQGDFGYWWKKVML